MEMVQTETPAHAVGPTLARLSEEVARILNVDSVCPDITLLDLGIDSLTAVELTLACDQIYFDVDPERLVLTKDTTLRDLDRQMAPPEG